MTHLRGPAGLGLAVVAVMLTACGGNSSSTAAATTAPQAQPTSGPAAAFGTFGLAAAVDGATIQVQNPQSGQTAVVFTSSTTWRKTAKVTRAALAVGDCVTVRPASTSASPSATTAPIVAGTVSISAASSSGCSRGGGTRPPGAGSFTPPAGAPSPRPSDANRRFGGGGAFGQVTSVTAAGFVVKSTAPAGTGATPSTTTTESVETTSTTTYEKTLTATAKALRTGECVAAMGTTDSTGKVHARSITLSQPVSGSCTSGFGGGFGRFGQGATPGASTSGNG